MAVAEASAALALDQINDVLELTRLEGDAALEDLSDFNLCATVREMAEQVSPLAARQKNKISLDLPPEANCWLQGHRRSFLRVLLNLLGNAAKFTTGGTITLSVHVLDQPDGLSLVRVEISDTGIGIASEKLSTIFEPFETLDNGYDRVAEGTGLGLGIARRTVERMGARSVWTAAWVKAAPSGSPRPWRACPAGGKAGRRPDTEAAAAPTPQPPVQEILIVEDNPTNRIVLREMLRHLGQTVVEASNGSEAVELARHRRFDLIFMDVSMPEIDGVTASRQIRAGAIGPGLDRGADSAWSARGSGAFPPRWPD
ncbi:hybrid sensor histidine kinase/response regulator [Gemmobacter lanyuensis]